MTLFYLNQDSVGAFPFWAPEFHRFLICPLQEIFSNAIFDFQVLHYAYWKSSASNPYSCPKTWKKANIFWGKKPPLNKTQTQQKTHHANPPQHTTVRSLGCFQTSPVETIKYLNILFKQGKAPCPYKYSALWRILHFFRLDDRTDSILNLKWHGINQQMHWTITCCHRHLHGHHHAACDMALAIETKG